MSYKQTTGSQCTPSGILHNFIITFLKNIQWLTRQWKGKAMTCEAKCHADPVI